MLRSLRSSISLCVLACVSPHALQSQSMPGASARRSPVSTYTVNESTGMQHRLPTILSGKVLTQDLQPVTEATVRLVCDGVIRGTGTARTNGEFSITVDQPMNAAQVIPLSGCDVSAALGELRSDLRPIGTLRPSESRDVGQIVVHPPVADNASTISAVSLLAPPEARKWLRKGRDAAATQKWNDAQKHLERAVQLYPKYAEAWHELGLVLQRMLKREEARAAFQQAIVSDPAFSRPYFGLVGLAADAQDWPEMQHISDAALPRVADPLMFFYHAIASFNLQQYDVAEKSLLRAVELDRRHQLPQIELLLGDILIQRHDFAGAAAKVRDYLLYSPEGTQADAARAELARLEELNEH